MFSRRHPILFFLLMITAILMAGIFLSSLALSFGFRGLFSEDHSRDTKKNQVGVVEIAGAIVESDETLRQIKAFRDDDRIKAIVVRINSPGGGVGASQEIYREIRKTTQTKKVVASMASVAASGGYYVAAATDKIMANPGTVTGSIGVIMGYTNIEKLLEKIGVLPVVIKSGRYKDLGSPVRELAPEEREILQQFSDGLHAQFISDVAQGRGLDEAKVVAVADGRVFTGKWALEYGLVDQLGNLEDALALAGQLAGLEGEVNAVYPETSRFRLGDLLEQTLRTLMLQTLHPQMQAAYLYRAGQ
jgi:protease-4